MTAFSPDVKRFFRDNAALLTICSGIVLVILVMGATFFVSSSQTLEQELKERMQTIASVAVEQFDGDAVASINSGNAIENDAFYDAVTKLNTIRDAVPQAIYVYIMRRTAEPMILEFVADADSLKSFVELDENQDGMVSADEEGSYPGDPYDISDVPALQGPAFQGPAVDDEITTDQWGSFISGYAPIRDQNGGVIAILGIDMDATLFINQTYSVFSPIAFILVLLVALLVAGLVASFTWHKRIEGLKRMDSERTSLLRLASHQLGAPLASIRWWIDILCEGRKRSIKETEACHYVQEATQRMTNVLETLKQADTIQKKKIHYKPRKTSIEEIIKTCVESTKPLRKSKKQHLKLDVCCTPNMRIDAQLIAGVVHELLENASLYSKDSTTITLGTTCDRRHVVLWVTDQGCGVPRRDRERIFKKFTRGSNAQKMKPVGNGMGLYVAREIVEQAGGKMWVESKEGEGSTFSFTLPIAHT